MSTPERGRPSLRAAVSNWRTYDASFPTKLALSWRNTWRKLKTRNGCCGNDGEPGC